VIYALVDSKELKFFGYSRKDPSQGIKYRSWILLSKGCGVLSLLCSSLKAAVEGFHNDN
jgi:hypothetical protein